MQVRLVDTGDLKAINKALRQLEGGKEIRQTLSRELRGIVREQGLVENVRQAWRSAPSKGAPHRGGRADLRVLLAKATGVSVRLTGKQVGVTIRTDGRKLPDRMKALPGYAEGVRRRPWRHPVYGNRNVWAAQQPFPRFYDAVQPDEHAAREAIQKAVERTASQIVRGAR